MNRLAVVLLLVACAQRHPTPRYVGKVATFQTRTFTIEITQPDGFVRTNETPRTGTTISDDDLYLRETGGPADILVRLAAAQDTPQKLAGPRGQEVAPGRWARIVQDRGGSYVDVYWAVEPSFVAHCDATGARGTGAALLPICLGAKLTPR